mgnify:CR=1 FL=1
MTCLEAGAQPDAILFRHLPPVIFETVMGVALAFALGWGIAVFVIFPKPALARDEVAVPSLTGLTMEGAREELGDMEAMMQVAERLFGPYRWGREADESSSYQCPLHEREREQLGGAEGAAPATVTLNVENEPFWPAVDKLLDSAKLGVYNYGEDGLAVVKKLPAPQDVRRGQCQTGLPQRKSA